MRQFHNTPPGHLPIPCTYFSFSLHNSEPLRHHLTISRNFGYVWIVHGWQVCEKKRLFVRIYEIFDRQTSENIFVPGVGKICKNSFSFLQGKFTDGTVHGRLSTGPSTKCARARFLAVRPDTSWPFILDLWSTRPVLGTRPRPKARTSTRLDEFQPGL